MATIIPMSIMKIEEMKISELVEYENNPRVIEDDAVEAVAKSIKEFGWKQPIVVDKNNTIIAGHTRFKAAKLLGLETVPVVIADDLTEDEVRAYRIIDNKSSELTLWNPDMLMKELSAIDFDMTSWKFDTSALENLDMSAVTPDIQGIAYKEKFGVVIDCDDEPMQRAVFEFVTAGGYQARIVSI